jgi:hypothetical protein
LVGEAEVEAVEVPVEPKAPTPVVGVGGRDREELGDVDTMPEYEEERVDEYEGELELVTEGEGELVPKKLILPVEEYKGEEEKAVLADRL